jgi:hypothetical protein
VPCTASASSCVAPSLAGSPPSFAPSLPEKGAARWRAGCAADCAVSRPPHAHAPRRTQYCWGQGVCVCVCVWARPCALPEAGRQFAIDWHPPPSPPSRTCPISPSVTCLLRKFINVTSSGRDECVVCCDVVARS